MTKFISMIPTEKYDTDKWNKNILYSTLCATWTFLWTEKLKMSEMSSCTARNVFTASNGTLGNIIRKGWREHDFEFKNRLFN